MSSLVIGGKRILRQLARLCHKSSPCESLFLSADVAAAGRVNGCRVDSDRIVGVLLIYRYPTAFMGVFAFGLTFGNGSWKPLHDVALISKYLGVVCLVGIGALFLYKNIWRLIATPYLRLWLIHIIWTAAICIFLGGKNNDFWYLGSEFALVVGFSIVWLETFVKDSQGLYEFNKVLAWTAIVILFFNLLAPVLAAEPIYNSRFKGYTNRATMFAIVFSPAVLALFWMSMNEKKALLRQIFAAAAMLGFGLILWSGTRSAIAGVLLGVGILWWVFRTRIMYLLVVLAFFGLILQIVAGGSSDVTAISDRLQTADTGRTILWARYFPLGLESPIYGYSPTGTERAIVGGSRADFLAGFGVSAAYKGFHNAYLAMFLKFGGVGVGLMLLLLGLAMRRARLIIFSSDVPLDEKKLYVLPVAIMVVISIEAIIEDIISASGKGTIIGLSYFSSLILCEMHGRRLYEQYVVAKPESDVQAKSQVAVISEESSIAL